MQVSNRRGSAERGSLAQTAVCGTILSQKLLNRSTRRVANVCDMCFKIGKIP
jgi:hypothetical protein